MSRRLKPTAPPVSPLLSGGPDHERFRDPNRALASWKDKQTQWWYFTGHLQTKAGRRFGYQLVFFERVTTHDYLGFVPSHWVTPLLHVGHFALSDIDAPSPSGRYRAFQKGGIVTVGQAFSSSECFHVDLGGWWAHRRADGTIQLHGHGRQCSLTLELEPAKDLCYHAHDGFSPRGEPGVASFYCSYTRLKARGRLVVDGQVHAVEGSSWMDHEKQLVSPYQFVHGWNWYSLQLDSGRELMVYLLKEAGGKFNTRHSFGSWVEPDGRVRHLKFPDIEWEPIGYWKSARSRGNYPIRSRLRIPAVGFEATVHPLIEDAEFDATRTAFCTYWEGPVEVTATVEGKRDAGRGFLELTGYDQRKRTRLLHFLILPEAHPPAALLGA